jgi:hypothetical protein
MELLPPDDPWASYARTVVVVVLPDTTNLVVEAAAPGRAGVWPWPTDDAVHVLTAWDPGDARRGEDENRANQSALESAVVVLGPNGRWDAVGVDPMSGHREEGLAVSGLSLDAVLDLGAAFGQDAIFEWTRSAWSVVACRGDRHLDFGWAVAPDVYV